MRRTLKYISCLLLLSLLSVSGMLLPVDGASVRRHTGEESRPLRLEGKVIKIERRMDEYEQGSNTFDLKLSLTFINTGSRAVILLRREPWLVVERLARSPEDAAANNYIYKSAHFPSIFVARGNNWERGDDEWAGLYRQLNQTNPPPERTLTLQPGASWTSETEITLDFPRGGSSKMYEIPGTYEQDIQPWESINKTLPIWLQVVLEMWPINVEPKLDHKNSFGKKLQRRWQKAGDLWLEDMMSEPIQLDLNIAGINVE